MKNQAFCSAVETLRNQYMTLDWSYQDMILDGKRENLCCWPGPKDEEILVLVHQSGGHHEEFHRHDFFYFNFTYEGEYGSVSCQCGNCITIRQGELYAGQPFAGHALCVHDNKNVTIIGVLIQKQTFFRSFLPLLSSNFRLFHFFLVPSSNRFSDEFIHFRLENDCAIRTLLKMMVIEYANKKADTQDILKPLALAFLVQIERQYAAEYPAPEPSGISEQVLQYMSSHSDVATLKCIASHFSYHPNYLSSLLRRETGKSFSELLLAQRMEKAALLLSETGLSVEEIAPMLGYGNSSNFYKAFRKYYRCSPRKYIQSKGA